MTANLLAAETTSDNIAVQGQGIGRPIGRNGNGQYLRSAAEIVTAIATSAAVFVGFSVVIKIGNLPVEVVSGSQLFSRTGETGNLYSNGRSRIQHSLFRHRIALGIGNFYGNLLCSHYLISVNTIFFYADNVTSGGQSGNGNCTIIRHLHSVSGKFTKGQCFRAHRAAAYRNGAAVLRLKAD